MINLTKIQEERSIEELIKFSIINIDKPAGPTSFNADVEIKKSLGLTKTSHFGTLDPIVTGVLPVALSRACRLMPYFIGKKKTYVGIMRMHNEISIEEINKHIKNFIGKISQLPPVKSRVKREFREREVYSFKILEVSENKKDFLFETEVEAGTYIRKLIHDLGQAIDDSNGAHMIELRRIQASIFNEKDSITIYQFLEAVEDYKKGNEKKLRLMLIPGEIISKVLPVVYVKKQYLIKLYHGSPLFKEHFENIKQIEDIKNEEKVALFNDDNFVGVFNLVKSKKKESNVIATPEFVLQPIK
ncbi:MAG: RNA-guided pseudouridylation complex pseudouridine synthase subunit Cbf5 [Nanoarchaeota archaeon]